MSREQEIQDIEEEIRKTPYHKATQAHIGRLKAKLAKLREEGASSSGGGYGAGFGVKKSGDATVLLVGFPSVGKSTLLNRLTNAKSKTGHYDFTTLEVIPGMLEYKGAKIQLLDVPGLIADASKGAGKGKQVLSAVRNADLIIFVMDSQKQMDAIEKELYDAGFRLDMKEPDVRITRKDTGGLNINIAIKKPLLDRDTVKSVLGEFKLHNADVLIRENVTVERLIDSFMKNRIYVPSLKVLNKSDKMEGAGSVEREVLRISALKGKNIAQLREAIWRKLGLIRLYMKRIGKEPDMEEPLIMKKGSTVMDVAVKILRGQEKYLKYARIWGPSARFPEQKVGPEHKLKDEDIVEIHA